MLGSGLIRLSNNIGFQNLKNIAILAWPRFETKNSCLKIRDKEDDKQKNTFNNFY